MGAVAGGVTLDGVCRIDEINARLDSAAEGRGVVVDTAVEHSNRYALAGIASLPDLRGLDRLLEGDRCSACARGVSWAGGAFDVRVEVDFADRGIALKGQNLCRGQLGDRGTQQTGAAFDSSADGT